MVGKREVDEMHRNFVQIHFHIWSMREIDVVEGTQTLKRNTGHLHIELHSSVELDWTGRFDEQGKIGKMLFTWWTTIRKKEIEAKHIEPLTFDVYRLHTNIKTFLNISTDANYYG
jgi:hypothetical protein